MIRLCFMTTQKPHRHVSSTHAARSDVRLTLTEQWREGEEWAETILSPNCGIPGHCRGKSQRSLKKPNSNLEKFWLWETRPVNQCRGDVKNYPQPKEKMEPIRQSEVCGPEIQIPEVKNPSWGAKVTTLLSHWFQPCRVHLEFWTYPIKRFTGEITRCESEKLQFILFIIYRSN